MNTLDYVGLAKSNDPTRPSLTQVVRHKGRLVATDGHRMHWSEPTALSKDDKFYALDGNEMEAYPDYEMVLSDKAKTPIATLVISKFQAMELVVRLKKIVSLYGKDKDKLAVLSLNNNCTKIKGCALNIQWELNTTEYFGATGKAFIRGMNLAYLIDALALVADKKSSENLTTIEIGEADYYGIVVKTGDCRAIIMPIRIEEGIEESSSTEEARA